MFAPGGFAPTYPVESYPPSFMNQPVPRYVNQPAPRYANQPALPHNSPRPAAVRSAVPVMPPVAAVRPTGASRPTPPVVRAQMEEESRPAPARLTLPSPEQLGLASPTSTGEATDWSKAHQRLDQLGAVCFHLDKLPKGCRVVCLLPTTQENRLHRIEVEAGSETEAVRLAIERAEAWTGKR